MNSKTFRDLLLALALCAVAAMMVVMSWRSCGQLPANSQFYNLKQSPEGTNYYEPRN